jgi:hypothetical protein
MSGNALALGLGLGFFALVALGMVLLHHCLRGCGGFRNYGCPGHGYCYGDCHGRCTHLHTHTLYSHSYHDYPCCPYGAVDDLRAAHTPRLNRHRRDIDQLRGDHDQLRTDHDQLRDDHDQLREEHDQLGRDHDGLSRRVTDHMQSPHDTAAITALLARYKETVFEELDARDRRRDEEMDTLRAQIRALQDRPVPDHHHRFHTPHWVLSGVLGMVAFIVMYLLDLTVISRAFVNHFAIIVKHVTFGVINFDWSWAKLGLAFAVGFSLFAAVAVVTSLFHTERTSDAIAHNVQQVP